MEVRLDRISFEEYIQYSDLTFAGDIDMQTTYGTLESGETPAKRNVKNIREFRQLNPNYKCKFYKVVLAANGEEKPIGMTITVKIPYSLPLLYSFGINIEYRTGEILRAWMGELDALLGEKYIVSLFLKNSRAIKFFMKNGFNNTKIDEKTKGIMMWR